MTDKYSLPDLPYDLGDLEPVISAEIMDLHYNKHHKTYINNLNNLLEQLEEAQSKNDISKAISLQSGINFNGGGYINHSIFWTNLAPKGKGGGEAPTGPLADGSASTKTKTNSKSQPAKIKTRWQQKALSLCWESMSGNMPITCSIKMYAPITSKPSGILSIGKTSLIATKRLYNLLREGLPPLSHQ